MVQGTQFDTTATAQQDAAIQGFNGNTPGPTGDVFIGKCFSSAPGMRRSIFAFKLPSKPVGADSLDRITSVITYHRAEATSAPMTDIIAAYTIQRPWVENDVTWLSYASTILWTIPNAGGFVGGGDLQELIGTKQSSSGYGSSFSIDVTRAAKTWDDHFSILYKSTLEDGVSTPATTPRKSSQYFGRDGGSTATVAWMPHIVVTATDNAPDAVTDLAIIPDVSGSEASYTFRQRSVLVWSPSDANDFSRYRIRTGVNRALAANHTHLTFLNSRASTSYLDESLYSVGSTVYYSLYVEDQRNKSASTNCNVSNIVSRTVPRIALFSPTVSAPILTPVSLGIHLGNGTNPNRVKKGILYWGDGSRTESQVRDSTGTYIGFTHYYTKATVINQTAQVEDIDGFRGPQMFPVAMTALNPGPIAKVVASPSRQRTGGTFSFGQIPAGGSVNNGFILIEYANPSRADGVVTRFTTRASSVGGGQFYAQLWREQFGAFQCIYSDPFTLATAGVDVSRNIDWKVSVGDYVGIQTLGGGPNIVTNGGANLNAKFVSTATAATPGKIIRRSAFGGNSSRIASRAGTAYTNPVSFSAKDSFARGSNRTINRFRWAPNYAGDFGAAYATGGSYTTGATSSFYWAWTTATTQFVAVRAVDDTNASSIDVAGVVIETESTFRIPDNLYGVVTSIKNPRSRAFTQSPALARDYGTTDLGALEPMRFDVRGKAFVSLSTNNFYTDISNLNAAFQQRWRLYVRDPATTASYVQGYLVDVPFVQDTNEPTVKTWDATVVIAT